jgi:membrane protein DedA with SNARE-associated domain
MYQFYYVNYYQYIILTFIAGLLWATGLWTVGVMPDNDILPPLPRPVGLAKGGTQMEARLRCQDELINN